jgi:cell division protein FtsB
MSAATARVEAPLRVANDDRHPRRVEVVSTRAQRRARPRIVYALVGVLGLFGIFIAQLLLSISAANGAYSITKLQNEQKELLRTEQSLTESIETLKSPQNLAANAEALGMVSNAAPAYLRLSDGAVLGTATAAGAGQGVLAGQSLVGNELLVGVPIIDPAAIAAESEAALAAEAAAALTTESGATTGTTTGTSSLNTPGVLQPVTPVGALPAPVTH